MKRLIPLLILISVISISCVPSRMHNELKAKKSACDKENEELKAANLQLNTRQGELSAMVEDLKIRIKALESDTTIKGQELRDLRGNFEKLNNTYQTLLKDGPNAASNTEATRQLIRDLQKTQEQLQKKEDELSRKAKMLSLKEDSLSLISGELSMKNRRLAELEQILASKDSAVKALRNSVAKALLGYQDKGLSVEMKNGKVYVMMEERLLFATGSTVVDPKGVEAIRDLGKVLEKNPDINIQIEGHTDNVPMHGTGEIKDNWDLSVMRATSVVKILLTGSTINAIRITAAGRGEFMPVDKANTTEGRKKNRRIEVILSPKLDEILKLLETH
ncbi:MAG: OmpA family protein [Bacteroidetes bacterium]|nr:OmpA family protein [Bacteroidota bacterium]